MSYKCHHCDIFSSDLLKALEYKMQIFIDMNQKILIGGNILVFVNSKFWSMHLIWLYSYLKRTLIPVIIFLGNFWPKFLFILCKVHQEKKWWLNPITYFDYHSCTCEHFLMKVSILYTGYFVMPRWVWDAQNELVGMSIVRLRPSKKKQTNKQKIKQTEEM